MKKILSILLFIPFIGLGQIHNSSVNVGFNVVLPIADGNTSFNTLVSPGFSAEYIFPSIRLSYYTLSYVPSVSYSVINLRESHSPYTFGLSGDPAISTGGVYYFNSIQNYININQNLTYRIHPAIEVSSGVSFDTHIISFYNNGNNSTFDRFYICALVGGKYNLDEKYFFFANMRLPIFHFWNNTLANNINSTRYNLNQNQYLTLGAGIDF